MEPANHPPVSRAELVAAASAVIEAQLGGYVSGPASQLPYAERRNAYEALHSRALAHKAACERALREAQGELEAETDAQSQQTFVERLNFYALNDRYKMERMMAALAALNAFCAACDVLDGGVNDEKA